MIENSLITLSPVETRPGARGESCQGRSAGADYTLKCVSCDGLACVGFFSNGSKRTRLSLLLVASPLWSRSLADPGRVSIKLEVQTSRVLCWRVGRRPLEVLHPNELAVCELYFDWPTRMKILSTHYLLISDPSMRGRAHAPEQVTIPSEVS
ncbi:hypothetical protein EVAR_31222_1 [Eumeta japonica]|uniref:Uncharacterized protein n=1 Tax=Eumeta variegata TaxID=151549 RepID=A0A4C1W1G1_EUMVA|nr:hypothetical protein EVAR_31222_1 [Eumeta japonica]